MFITLLTGMALCRFFTYIGNWRINKLLLPHNLHFWCQECPLTRPLSCWRHFLTRQTQYYVCFIQWIWILRLIITVSNICTYHMALQVLRPFFNPPPIQMSISCDSFFKILLWKWRDDIQFCSFTASIIFAKWFIKGALFTESKKQMQKPSKFCLCLSSIIWSLKHYMYKNHLTCDIHRRRSVWKFNLNFEFPFIFGKYIKTCCLVHMLDLILIIYKLTLNMYSYWEGVIHCSQFLLE